MHNKEESNHININTIAFQWNQTLKEQLVCFVKEATRFYRIAAEQGDAYAQYFAGLCFETGKGVLRNKKEALRLYRLAAE